jgi:hypothetical protein
MKTAIGNAKLGQKVIVVSRPVGDSCPDSCVYLNNGCYAQATERRFPNARQAGFSNMFSDVNSVRRTIRASIDSGMPIRIHERGDFIFINSRGKKLLDKRYLNAWLSALAKFEKSELPRIWLYTHCLTEAAILKLEAFGVSVYASVNTEEEYETAKKTGFKLFAFCSKFRKKKGGSKDFPVYTDQAITTERTLVCPEQRLGRNRVTCCGSQKNAKFEKTTACNWCVKGKGNIVFLEH